MLIPLHIRKKIVVVSGALVMFCLVLSGPPAMAQEQPDERKLTDPSAPGYEDPIAMYDPWEGFNRSMYKFNYGFDKYAFLPVVRAYDFILPDVVQTGIANFFNNLYEVTNVFNNLLQGNAEGTVNSTARIVFNSTLGLAGILDPATPMGFTKMKEDFGQTLGVWGAGPGPYLILPFLGPSTVRDGIGTGVDATVGTYWVTWVIDNVYSDRGDQDRLYWGLTGLYYISKRAGIPFRYYETGSPFEYELVRFVYLKDRQIKIEER
jgi:phospholipid-binding lipoprotein MlaA